MTQIKNLATRSPEIQERVLTNDLDATEKDLREIATEVEWEKQVDRLRGIGSASGRSGESSMTGATPRGRYQLHGMLLAVQSRE